MDRKGATTTMQNISKLLRQHAAKLIEAADLLDSTTTAKPTTHRAKGRRLSQAARRKISLAQKARWKVFHGGKKAA